jgi:hypothetical protein
MKFPFVILILTIIGLVMIAVPDSIVRREVIPREELRITQTQKISWSDRHSTPDTIINYDTTIYVDSILLLRTYTLTRIDTMEQAKPIPIKAYQKKPRRHCRSRH